MKTHAIQHIKGGTTIMHLIKRKSINFILLTILLLNLFIPQNAIAAVITGSEDNPSLTIHKYEQEAGTTGESGTGGQQVISDENIPLPGVEFTLTQTHQYNATTDTWDEVTGVKPLVETTDSNGQIVFNKDNGLKLGRYQVKETAGPAHVVLNEEAFTIEVPMTSSDGKSLNYDVVIYPKNETVRGNVELQKDGENGAALSDAKFKLFNQNGTVATDTNGNEIPELSTNADGKISVEGLAAGQYYFQEIEAPTGYLTSNKKIEFEITKDNFGKTQTVDVTNYSIPEIVKDVEEVTEYIVNRDTAYNYNINVKTPLNINEFVELSITDVLDNRLSFTGKWSVTGTDQSNVSLTQVGQQLIWSINDLTVLTPGADIKITFEAKIKPDAKLDPSETGIPNTAKLDFDNNSGSYTKPKDGENPPYDPPTTPPVIVTPTEGGLHIVKVDKQDNTLTLEGAEFKLTTDQAGENIVNAAGTIIQVNGEAFTGNLENLATNNEGSITIEGLTPGKYYLHETKAPSEYRLLTKPIKVDINNTLESGTIDQVTVENSKSDWLLPQTGGSGTLQFTTVGLTLMGLSLFLYNRRKKEMLNK